MKSVSATSFHSFGNRAHCQPYLVFSCVAAVIGTSFIYGYIGVVVNEPSLFIRDFINQSAINVFNDSLTSEELGLSYSLFTSLWPIGGLLGSFWLPRFEVAKVGSSRAMAYNAGIGVIGGLLLFIAKFIDDYAVLMVGQAIVGIHTGLSIVILPSLLTELAPVEKRGLYGTLNDVSIGVGELVSSILSLPYILGTSSLWNYLYLVPTVLYVLHGIFMSFAAEGPQYLIDKGLEDDAFQTLRKIRYGEDEQKIAEEFQYMKDMSKAGVEEKYKPMRAFFKDRKLWWPLFLSVSLFFMQQLSGLTVMNLYSSQLMKEAGMSEVAADFGFLSMCVVGLAANIFSMYIVDRVGRRILLLSGIGIVIVSQVFITFVLVFKLSGALVLVGFMFMMVASSIGPGPIPWYLAAEMFPNDARPTALTACMTANWLANAITTFSFAAIRIYIPDYAFLPYAGYLVYSFILFYLFLPETTGYRSDEISEMFADGQPLLKYGQPLLTKQKSLLEKQSSNTAYKTFPGHSEESDSETNNDSSVFEQYANDVEK